MIFVATKIGTTNKKFSPSSFRAVVGSGIRDKHPGSATLKIFICVERYGILLDTETEVGNGAGEVPLDEDVPGLEVAVRYGRLPLNRGGGIASSVAKKISLNQCCGSGSACF
jgi:hypothetical protein